MIPNQVDITLRPKIVARKTRIGDWEADTIIGKSHQGAIVSLVDRKTKFTKLIKVKDKTAASVTSAIISSLLSLPITHQTITFDNGKEIDPHQEIVKQTGAKTYFATPRHSWERGLNEQSNGLVRQYIPKSTYFDTVDDEAINRIENDLNNRPRKVLGFRSPNEVMQKHLRRLGVALHG
jgi:transposase, IS30 family